MNEDKKTDNAVLKGICVSNAIAFSIIGMSRLLFPMRLGSGMTVLIFSEFIIIPVMMGIICSWYWRSVGLGSRRRLLYAVCNSFLAIFLSYIFLGEGVICLLIVSPLILAFMCLGTFIGREMFGYNNGQLNLSIMVLLLFIFIADARSGHHYENEMSDTIVINAPPDKVWEHVVEFEPIQQKNKYWLFRIGMPSPMASTVTGHYKGAGRKCIFSNGYVFGEKIVTYDQNKDLTFDIIDQPRDPEIMGHIDIERGQFLLHDNGNGTTTLIGNSWYKLYVFPVWYYDIWAQSITRNVHLRAMEHIKELSEKN